jgi:hypothetical protein
MRCGILTFDHHPLTGEPTWRQQPEAISVRLLFVRGAADVAAAAMRARYTFRWIIVTIAAWAVSRPVFDYSHTWQLIITTGTTIITFLMLFLIEYTQNRDTTAISRTGRPHPRE